MNDFIRLIWTFLVIIGCTGILIKTWLVLLKDRKQPMCLPIEEQLNELWYSHVI